MAQPLNARGTYFGGGNRGLGTIIGREETGTFFDSGLRVAQRQKAEEQAAKTKREEQLDKIADVEIKDVFMPYLDASSNMLDDITQRFADGQLSDAELTMELNRYKAFVYKGNQMGEEFENVSKLYDEDARINAAAARKGLYLQAGGDGTPESLQGVTESGLDNLYFLNEEGGSAYLNNQEVISTMTNNIATDIRQRIDNGDREVFGGNVWQSDAQINTEFSRIFEEVVTNNGTEYRLRDPNDPKAKEIIDSSLQDRFFSRIVYDQLREENPEKEAFTKEEARDKAIRILGGYSETKIERDEKTTARSIPQRRAAGRGRGTEVDEDARRTEWYRHLMSGNPTLTENALNYFTGSVGIEYQDLRTIMSPESRSELESELNIDDLNNSAFNIQSARFEDGKAILTVTPDGDISKKGGIFGTGILAGSLKSGEEKEIVIDLRSNTTQEFWNEYYNIANTYSTTGEKSHYNENKGGQIGAPTTPSAPTTSSVPTGGGELDDL